MTTRLPVLLWLATLALCGWWVAFRTTVATDITYFLSRQAGVAEQILVDQLREGVASKLVLMGIEGAEPETLAHTSDALLERLRPNPYFAYLSNGREALAPADRELLFRHRYLLSSAVNAERFSIPGLVTAFQDRLGDLASPIGMLEKPLLSRDPTAEFMSIAKNWLTQQGPSIHHGVWFSKDGKRALLLAETRAPGFDTDSQVHIVDFIRTQFSALNSGNDLRLLMSGTGVFSVEANTSINNDAGYLSAINSIIIILMLWFIYRSIPLILLSLVPLATGGLVATAAVSVLYGGVHGITLGFGATLIGVAVDYPIHIFTHLMPQERVQTTVKQIWPTIELGVLTTVAGFAGMLFSSFAGLSQLGVFGVVGLLAAGAVCRWVMPVLIPANLRFPAWVDSGFGLPTLLKYTRGLWWVPILGLLLAGISLVVSPRSLWNDDVDYLNPVPEVNKKLDEQLRAELGAPDLRKLIVILAPSEEAALQRSEQLSNDLEQLVKQKAIAGFDMAALYLPSQQLQAERQAVLPDGKTLAANLGVALQNLPFKQDVFELFLQDVAQAKNGSLLGAAQIKDTAFGLKYQALLFPRIQQWVALIPLKGVANEEQLDATLARHTNAELLYLDLREESTRLVTGYRQEALRLVGGGSLVIALMLWIRLRSWQTSLRVLLPIAASVALTTAILCTYGVGLSLFHLVSLLLVMGLGIDYGLFFNREAATPLERKRTLLSLIICVATDILAFGMLAFSRFSILNAIGITVTLGALFCIVLAGMMAKRCIVSAPQ